MSPSGVQKKAKAGLIPAAKPGKSWVFLEDDLVDFLRSLYAGGGQAPLSGSSEEKSLCHYTNAVKPGGFASQHPTAKEYADLLGLPIKGKHRNTTTI
jgi:hypothetical protein